MAGILSNYNSGTGWSGRRDLIVIGTAVVTLLGLTAAGTYLLDVGDRVQRIGAANGELIIGLLLLNLAFTIYGWRRYSEAVREAVSRKVAERKAQSLASTDPLTGFLNRRSMNERVSELVASAGSRKQSVAILMIDLDGFKTINDLHGHLTGDSLLRITARSIEEALPADCVIARLGADDFAAAFAFDPANAAAVDTAAQGLVDRLGKPFDVGGLLVGVSASIGISRSGSSSESVEALLRRADIAMYSARKAGRGRYAWFDESMRRELEKRNDTEAAMRAGIPEGQFVPYFEPQVDLISGTLEGFEMLARWLHPERGLVPPDEFIATAEECGLIGELSLSVMGQALLEAREWDNKLRLSVNISSVQLKDPWLAQKIAKLLAETSFPAERLEVEITEIALFENLGLAQAIVSSLKNQGIRLALDDFGTGYSSLAHLRALPFDRIKIDRSFVSSINDNPESAAMVAAITRLGESLNLAVTAEGIEDELIEAQLRSIGNYTGQGWTFGKPMPVEDVRTLLAGKGLLPAARSYRSRVSSNVVTRIRRAG